MGVMDKVGVRVEGEGYVRGETGDESGNLEIKMVESYFSGQVAIVSPSICRTHTFTRYPLSGGCEPCPSARVQLFRITASLRFSSL